MPARSSIFNSGKSLSCLTVKFSISLSFFDVTNPSLGIFRIGSSLKIFVFPAGRESDTQVELTDVSHFTLPISSLIFYCNQ